MKAYACVMGSCYLEINIRFLFRGDNERPGQ